MSTRRPGRVFSSTSALAEHKSKERILDGGEWWLSPRAARRHVGVSYTTLARWWGRCPWLGDKGIRTRKLPGGYDRLIIYAAEADLNQVRDAKATRACVPEYPGQVHVEAAARECGVRVRTLRRAYAAYRRHCAGQGKGSPAVAEDRPAKSAEKRVRALPRSYVPRAFVEWFKRERELAPDADKISVAEASGILGLTIPGVHSLIFRGLLKAEDGRILCKGGYPRKGLILSRAEVQAHRDAQRAKYGPAAEQMRQEKAEAVLQALLADGGWHLRTDIVQKAVSQGVRQDLVYAAAKSLKLERKRERLGEGKPGRGPAHWRLPATAGSHTADPGQFGRTEETPVTDPSPPTRPGAGADTRADNPEKKRRRIPENPEVLRLARKIKAERGTAKSLNEIALDFTEGKAAKAASLLRQLRRYRHLYE